MGNRQAVVAVVKSETAQYDRIPCRRLVERAMELLEQQGVTVRRRGSVFIKPNVVIDATAVDSITTEPRLVAALVALLREAGAREVFVGDSSAGFLRAADTFRAAGMDEAVRRAGGQLVNIDDEAERVSIELPGSDIVRSLTVPRKALEADLLVNFGKLKTHRVGSMTACVKNWVGFLAQPLRLAHHQTRMPKLVAELHKVLPEHLCLADALVVGEGDGPDLSTPRFLGAVLAANDPVALDAVAADLLGMHRGDLLFPWAAHLEGVGEIERNRIRVVGDSIESLAIRVEKPVAVLYNRFPCDIVLGGVCEGCFAWFMGPALFWRRDGIWPKITANAGRPTFMLGFNAVDLNFEKHLEQGPYFVIGDCTPRRFQEDPRTVFIPGCCPGPAIPETILKTCGIGTEGGQG
jgi:uncharacterized protein (DUF362 family)